LLTDFFGAAVLETTWTPANWVVSANIFLFRWCGYLVTATARRGGGSSRKNKQTEKKDLFSQDEIPKKREKREKEHSRLNEKKQQCFILLFFTHSIRVITFSLPAIKKRTRAEMRDTFIE